MNEKGKMPKSYRLADGLYRKAVIRCSKLETKVAVYVEDFMTIFSNAKPSSKKRNVSISGSIGIPDKMDDKEFMNAIEHFCTHWGFKNNIKIEPETK